MTVQVTYHAGQSHRVVLFQDAIQMILTPWIQINVDYVPTRHVLRRHKTNTVPKRVNKASWTKANRTFLGRGKDTTMDFAGGVADALKGVWSGIQSSTPVSLVDVAYDKATDALADLTGGQKGIVMQAINKYRMLAKEYPKTAGLAKGALVAITGLATGGAGLPAVAALIYGLDAAVKGEKFSDIALKAGGAAATAWAVKVQAEVLLVPAFL